MTTRKAQPAPKVQVLMASLRVVAAFLVPAKVLPYAKAYAALVGSVVTSLLATVPPSTPLWTALTLVAAIATPIATFTVPNIPR